MMVNLDNMAPNVPLELIMMKSLLYPYTKAIFIHMYPLKSMLYFNLHHSLDENTDPEYTL